MNASSLRTELGVAIAEATKEEDPESPARRKRAEEVEEVVGKGREEVGLLGRSTEGVWNMEETPMSEEAQEAITTETLVECWRNGDRGGKGRG